jgi:hypothetical protein
VCYGLLSCSELGTFKYKKIFKQNVQKILYEFFLSVKSIISPGIFYHLPINNLNFIFLFLSLRPEIKLNNRQDYLKENNLMPIVMGNSSINPSQFYFKLNIKMNQKV